MSDGSGNYSTSVTNGWSGTVTPAKTGYAFIPASTVSNVTSNQTGQDYGDATGAIHDLRERGTGGVTLIGLPGNPVSDGSGNYSTSVTNGWSGTVTPAKTGYAFIPASRTYTNVTSNQTSKDYTATQLGPFTISGNTGTGGVTLIGLPGNPVSDGSGNYSTSVTNGWSGTVTPAKTGYAFIPASRTYTNVTSNQTGQDYTATQLGPFTISGNTGTGGVTLGGLPGNPVSDGSGNYSATVPSGWADGTVTPTKIGYTFSPASRTYTNVTSSQTGQELCGHTCLH